MSSPTMPAPSGGPVLPILVSRVPSYEMVQVSPRVRLSGRMRVRAQAGDACAFWMWPGGRRVFRNRNDAMHASKDRR